MKNYFQLIKKIVTIKIEELTNQESKIIVIIIFISVNIYTIRKLWLFRLILMTRKHCDFFLQGDFSFEFFRTILGFTDT